MNADDLIIDDLTFDARELLEQAEALELSGDLNAAVTRARDALRVARDPDLRDEIALALNRYHATERHWLDDAEQRRRDSTSRELALA